MITADSTVIKRSISLSKVVSKWADELAQKKGFGSNFSAYMADLVRRDRDREQEMELAANANSLKKKQAAEAIVELVQEAAWNKTPRKR
jgi:hypothetical protein